jgi:hypothetical protein
VSRLYRLMWHSAPRSFHAPAAMGFFPIGPLRLRLGRRKNVSVTLFGVAITAPALGAVYWLRQRRERRDPLARGGLGDDVVD